MQGSKRPPMSAGEVLGASPRGIPDPGPLPPPSQKSEPPPQALNYPARTLRPPPTSNTVIFLAQGKTLHCDYFPWEVLDCLGPREPPPHASRLTRRGQSPQGLCHLTGSPHRVTSVPSPGFQGHLTEAARTLPISPAGSIVPARKSSIPYAASLAYHQPSLQKPATAATAFRDARSRATSTSFHHLSGSVLSARETYLRRRCPVPWRPLLVGCQIGRSGNPVALLFISPVGARVLRCDRAPSISLELKKIEFGPGMATHICNPTIGRDYKSLLGGQGRHEDQKFKVSSSYKLSSRLPLTTCNFVSKKENTLALAP